MGLLFGNDVLAWPEEYGMTEEAIGLEGKQTERVLGKSKERMWQISCGTPKWELLEGLRATW